MPAAGALIEMTAQRGGKRTLTPVRLIYPLVTSPTDNSQATNTGVGYFRREFLQWVLVACEQTHSNPPLDKS